MNQQQRKYAIERVSAIKSTKASKLFHEFNACRKTLTNEERAELIRKGKVKMRADVTAVSRHTDVVAAFDFSKFEGHTAKQIADNAAAVTALEEEAANVRDQIMLGDAEEALKLLTAFSNS